MELRYFECQIIFLNYKFLCLTYVYLWHDDMIIWWYDAQCASLMCSWLKPS